MRDCTFCKIASGEEPAKIVFEDEELMVFLDIDPISAGHSLIIPRADIQDLDQLSEEMCGKLMVMAQKLARSIQKTFSYDGTMITSVSGTLQDVPHFHMHVFGRNKSNDIKVEYPKHVRHLGSEDFGRLVKGMRQ